MNIIDSTAGHALMCGCIAKISICFKGEVRWLHQRTHHTTTLNHMKLENQTVPGI